MGPLAHRVSVDIISLGRDAINAQMGAACVIRILRARHARMRPLCHRAVDVMRRMMSALHAARAARVAVRARLGIINLGRDVGNALMVVAHALRALYAHPARTRRFHHHVAIVMKKMMYVLSVIRVGRAVMFANLDIIRTVYAIRAVLGVLNVTHPGSA